MEGKTVVLTAANLGSGPLIAKYFAQWGARVIMGCNPNHNTLTEKLAQDMYGRRIPSLIIKELDLGSLRSVEKFADEVLMEESKVDLLINHGCTDQKYDQLSDDQYPFVVQVNYFALARLSLLLMPKLIAAAAGRIVNVMSSKYWFKKRVVRALELGGQSLQNVIRSYDIGKIALVMLTNKLVAETHGGKVTVNSAHPGSLLSFNDFGKEGELIKEALTMARTKYHECLETVLHLAFAEELASVRGCYYVRKCQVLLAIVLTKGEMYEWLYDYILDQRLKKMRTDDESSGFLVGNHWVPMPDEGEYQPFSL